MEKDKDNLMPPSLPVENGGDEIDIRALLALFIRKIWFILGITLIFLVGGAVVLFVFRPNEYQAMTRLVIEQSPKELYFNAQEYRELMIMPSRGNEFYNTQIELIKGDQSLRKLIDIIGIQNLISEKSFSEYGVQDVIRGLKKSIRVNRIPGTQLIDISVVSLNPVLAARVTNTLAQIYVDQYKSDIMALTREFAEMVFAQESDAEKQGKSNEFFENMVGLGENTEISRLRKSRIKLQNRMDELSVLYKEGHPEVTAIQRSMDKTDKKIRQEVSRVIEEWKNSLNGQYVLDRVRIVEYAQIPSKPVGPKRLRGLLVSLALGLAVGFGLAFLIEKFDFRIKTEEDVIGYSGLVCLGTIPNATRRHHLHDIQKASQEIKDTFSYLATAIRFSMPKENSKVILVTSSQRGEGRTTIAAHLAAALANEGLKIVVLDLDIQKAKQHMMHHVHKIPGLTSFLNKKVDLQKVIYKTTIPNLNLIPAGEPVLNVSELLNSEAMKNLIFQLKKDYDHIVIDVPPVADMPTDIILSFADGVVVVANAKKTGRYRLKEAMDQMADSDANVIGSILNQSKPAAGFSYFKAFTK